MPIEYYSRTLAMAIALFSFASGATPVKAGEFSNGIGAGIQYGGIVGWQGGYISGRNKTRISFGYSGYALGYDRYVWTNTSLGLQLFANQYRIGSALSLNYDIDGVPKTGLVVGLDIYRGYDSTEFVSEFYWDVFFDRDELDELDTEVENGAFISIGYHF